MTANDVTKFVEMILDVYWVGQVEWCGPDWKEATRITKNLNLWDSWTD